MTIFKINFAKICISMFLSQLFCASVICADNNVLLIGRPERGGVDLEKAQLTFPDIDEKSIYYLDPRSVGQYSITNTFPCSIPEDKPQQYGIVCFEQGMLNEVAMHLTPHEIALALIRRPDEVPLIIRPEPSPHEDKEFSLQLKTLADLEEKREKIWQTCTNLREKQYDFAKKIITAALEYKLIEESLENGEIYYRIPKVSKSKYDTHSEHVVVAHLNRIENSLEFAHILPLIDDLQKLKDSTDKQYKKMGKLDKLIEPIIKSLYSHNEQKQAVIEQEGPQTVIDLQPACENIQDMLKEAWQLVLPGGKLIVFSANAKLVGTDLAQGISEHLLRNTLPGRFEIEEIFFARQELDGDSYISNPVLPAITDAFNWTGWREAGSYFLVEKL